MRFLDNIGLRTFTLLQTFTRHRPRWMVNFAIEEANLSEGMRAGFACSMMLLLGALFNQTEFSWAAIGALWTCMADAAGNTRLRLLSMLSFTFLSAILGVLTAYTSSIGIIVSAITIFAIASLAGFVRIFNFAVYQVGILVAVACVVMVDNPLHGWHDTVEFVGIYLVGCFFATLLSVTIWRIHRFGPSRYALRMAFIRLSELAEDTARLIRAKELRVVTNGQSMRSLYEHKLNPPSSQFTMHSIICPVFLKTVHGKFTKDYCLRWPMQRSFS